MMYLLLFFCAIFFLPAQSQITSEWRGPGRTGIYNESHLLKEWPESGPEKLWSSDKVLNGYSSPAFGEKYIYVTGRKDAQEYLTALDYQGKQIWQVQFGKAWHKSYPETRTTPTIFNNKVYLISGQGEVVCHDAETGRQIWFRDANAEFSGMYNLYGPSEAPLIVEDKIFYSPGGFETSMIALDTETGELIWQTESIPDSAAYVSPLYVKHNEQEMIINILANWAFGVDPADGKILWKFDYIGLDTRQSNPYMIRTNCNTPLYHKGEVLLNKGYDHPSAMLSLNESGTDVNLKWTSFDFDTHMGGYVLLDGYLYGSNWISNGQGNWLCVDWETGATMWEEKWNNKGSVIYADGLLYFYEEKRGNLALVKPNQQKMDIISSFRIQEGQGPHWSHPVINKGILYIRHGEVLMAYNIKAD
ncbi:MAG: PQQ-like beta-propeller repeat protein [Bacteroidetes bacterium]|jgi:outer membrane protein assembly factor BamB|nr:PQQ-like beta-propeller repeat protein [Bacteroidota bacterium]MBT3747764.1 PQQ-like beta-propeller repeat protein [Bacteroidota bacterium]MBT4410838.1 PQQ-like beta-propeller repeat protein [Bacteroidota bacterium]MBT7464389.1 PQQ-like beta-propeller repeat protein [Bacteroidota bacterium]